MNYNLNSRISTIIIISLLLSIGLINSCSDILTENDKEPCPTFHTVPRAPYDSPVWHPNGNLIGFNYTPLDSITYPYGEHCIGEQHFNYDSSGFWLINYDGTNQRRILQYTLQTPVWSPDGKSIAFVSGGQIFKMPFIDRKFDTTQIIQLTYEGNNFFPTWSPDGAWIAYDSNKDSPNGMYFIWRMKSDGLHKVRIAYDPVQGEIRMPHWSPDGNSIVHIRSSLEFNSAAPEICIMDTNGSNFNRLTFNDLIDDHPKYSSHGDFISFIQTNSGRNLILTDDSGVNLLTFANNRIGESYSWAPNGIKIIFIYFDPFDWSYTNGTIWELDIDTGELKQLTSNK